MWGLTGIFGFLFSPDHFHWLHEHGKLIDRNRPEVALLQNPGLMDKAQIRELLTRYGPIDVIFLEGQPEGLRALACSDIRIGRANARRPELAC
jgi:alpha-L-fucosidase